jgi:16S rRNA (adenine1518-N6/adenine1519-N6)-dimethyltransferase
VGAGLGSLTVALAGAGAEVLAVETDRRLAVALEEVAAGLPVTIVVADATAVDWPPLLGGLRWRMASNLPYHAAVPILLDLLERAPEVDPFVVMVQREVGERLAAGPGEPPFGAVSLKVAYRAEVRVLRRIPPTVFWPPPNVESVLLRLDRRPPPVPTPPDRLFALIEEGFRERRKTMTTALVRLGLDRDRAREVLSSAGIDPRARAETLGLEGFAALAEALDG